MSIDERYQALFDQSPTPVLVLNREGKVLDLNRQARKTLGARRDRVVGRPVLASVVPEDRQRVKDLFLRVIEGQTREWTTRFLRGDGAKRVQWVRATPLRREGTVEGVVMFTRDVTETRAGRPETYQLQTLLENLPGQFVVVLDGRGQVRYSSGLSRTHYRDDIDTVGTPYQELLEADQDNRQLLAEMLEEVAAGNDWAGTHWHRRVDGSSFPVRTFASPYLDPRHGSILGALVAGREVSVEYDWRERAQRAQRLADIGSLVASISREFEGALSLVDGEFDALDQRYGNGRGVTDRVRAPIDSLHTLARSLNEFAGGVRLERDQVHVGSVVTDVLGDLADRISTMGARVEVREGDDVPAVHADPRHVRRVLRVLLENALDSLAGGERKEILVTLSRGAGSVSMRVADTGPGIKEEWLHRVFEPFFTTKAGRAGLGLAVAHGIVQAHGGRLWADGAADGGAVFTVELPLRAPESRLRFRPVPLTLTRTRSVLVVDDEDAVRAGIRRFLEKVGFEVREAWSGRSALAQITVGRPPELVLTDLRMSDGSGYWFLKQLARDFPDLLRRTVIVTGDTDHEEVTRLAEETGCPVVRKPIELPDLLELLDEVALRD